MKRLFLLQAFLLFVGLSSFSNSNLKNVELLKDKALQFITSVRHNSKTGITTRSAVGVGDANLNYHNSKLCVFNFDTGGFVVIGNDEKILAYSPVGYLNYDSAPMTVKNIMVAYTENRSLAKSMQIPADLPDRIDPLLGDISWNQDAPYNMMCPIMDGYTEPCVAGCTPIALSQIMYFHKYPEHGYGNAYYLWGDSQIGADLSQSNYQWNLMKPFYHGNESVAENEAVALLVRDVGYALNTQYSPSESSTSNLEPVKAMIDHFNYDKSIRNVRQSLFDDDEWYEIQFRELAAGRPYYYGGRSLSQGGHSLVCDGYDDEGRVHFNFGWGGEANGYYTMVDMPFSEYAEIIINIKPDEGGMPQLDPFVYTDLYWNGEEITFGYQVWAGASDNTPFVVALEFENKTTLEKFYSQVIHADKTYSWVEMLYPASNIQLQCPDGEYTVRLVIANGSADDVNVNNADWKYFHFKQSQQSKLYATVNNGVVTKMNNTEELNDPLDEGLVEINNIYYSIDTDSHTASVMRKNALRPSYTGDVSIPSEIELEGVKYTVKEIGKLAFEVCRKLGVVTIPKTVERICYGAFSRAEVDDLLFEDGSQLKYIDESALAVEFKQRKDRFVLPEGLLELGNNALGAMNVNDLIVPSTITVIGDMGLASKAENIFLNWTEPIQVSHDILTFQRSMDGARNYYVSRVHVPEGTLAKYAQQIPWCHFEIDEMRADEQSVSANIQGMNFILRGPTATLVGLDDNLTNQEEAIVIPSEVEYGGGTYKVTQSIEAFYGAKTTSITFPASMRTVSGINSCNNLLSVIFPSDSRLKNLSAIMHCPKLLEVTMPPYVEKLNNVFVNCPALKSVDIPGSVNWIMDSFNNTSLADIYTHWMYPVLPWSIMNAFLDTETPTIHVPVGTGVNYFANDLWGKFTIEEDASQTLDVSVDNASVMSFPEGNGADNYIVDVLDSNGEYVASATVDTPQKQNQTRSASYSSKSVLTFQLPALSEGLYSYLIRATSTTEGCIYYLEGKFKIDESMDISNINIDNDEYYDVYNINGMCIGHKMNMRQIQGLYSGLYILKSEGKSTFKKIMIVKQ